MRTTLRRGALLVATVLLALVGVDHAQAQVAYTANTVTSLYYKEILKDGRFYVFNDAAAAEALREVRRDGRRHHEDRRRPQRRDGLRRQRDRPRAVLLQARPLGEGGPAEAARRSPSSGATARPASPRQQLLHGDVEPHPAAVHPRVPRRLDQARRAPRAPGDSKGSFRIRRAKFKLEGWFYKPELEFEVQLNWPDVTARAANRFLEDANIDWDISKKKQFRVRFGQFKAPFGRQQLTSSGAQQFVDRAIQDARYNDGRETGLALWGVLGGNKLDWRVMISNGNGRSRP